MAEKNAVIYFHVGTGKTGSTFLQQRVFPKLQNIHYIPTNRYRRIFKILAKIDAPRILVSREFDQQLTDEVRRFCSHYPNAQAIIVFRRHDEYIASQYRRFVKNGFSGPFKNFFDLKNNNGHFKLDDLNYRKQLLILEEHFNHKPLVFLYDTLKENPRKFITDFSKAVKASVSFDQINFNVKHRSYSEKQLIFFRKLSGRFNLKKRRIFKNNLLHLIWRFYLGTIRYTLLYYANFIPSKKANNPALIDSKELMEIQAHYAADWEYVLAYSARQSVHSQGA